MWIAPEAGRSGPILHIHTLPVVLRPVLLCRPIPTYTCIPPYLPTSSLIAPRRLHYATEGMDVHTYQRDIFTYVSYIVGSAQVLCTCLGRLKAKHQSTASPLPILAWSRRDRGGTHQSLSHRQKAGLAPSHRRWVGRPPSWLVSGDSEPYHAHTKTTAYRPMPKLLSWWTGFLHCLPGLVGERPVVFGSTRRCRKLDEDLRRWQSQSVPIRWLLVIGVVVV